MKLPFGPVPLKLTPSCLMMSRRISAIVTRRLTWSAPRIVRALTTFPWGLLGDLPAEPPPPELFEMEIEGPVPEDEVGESLTKPEAMSSAFCASSAEATDPVRMIVFSTVRTRISLPGIAMLRSAVNSPTARPTETWKSAIRRPSLAKAKMLVWPLATPEI